MHNEKSRDVFNTGILFACIYLWSCIVNRDLFCYIFCIVVSVNLFLQSLSLDYSDRVRCYVFLYPCVRAAIWMPCFSSSPCIETAISVL